MMKLAALAAAATPSVAQDYPNRAVKIIVPFPAGGTADAVPRLIADWLSKHKKVEKIYYPGLPSHPQHEIAKRQMKTGGGMISMILKGGLPVATSFLKAVKIFTLAESLGGIESLIEHPAIMTHASIPPEVRRKIGIEDGLIRLSIGIENCDDLIGDLSQALR